MSQILFTLHGMGFLKTKEALRLLEHIKTIDDLKGMTRFDIEFILGRSIRVRSFSMTRYIEEGDAQLVRVLSKHIPFTTILDEDYPSALREIFDPPLILFYRGTLPIQDRSTIAVVGTRRASLNADREAFRLGHDIAASGRNLVSGLALGIDSSAHSGALAARSPNWAVLGTGCDWIYPTSNKALAQDILACGGGIISEFFPGTKPARYNFPRRNRIISGLSDSVVIVQAPASSGALYTADFALDQGRDVYVHQAGLQGASSNGTRSLYEAGATLIKDFSDLCTPVALSSITHAKASTWLDAGRELASQMRAEMASHGCQYKGRFVSFG